MIANSIFFLRGKSVAVNFSSSIFPSYKMGIIMYVPQTLSLVLNLFWVLDTFEYLIKEIDHFLQLIVCTQATFCQQCKKSQIT